MCKASGPGGFWAGNDKGSGASRRCPLSGRTGGQGTAVWGCHQSGRTGGQGIAVWGCHQSRRQQEKRQVEVVLGWGLGGHRA